MAKRGKWFWNNKRDEAYDFAVLNDMQLYKLNFMENGIVCDRRYYAGHKLPKRIEIDIAHGKVEYEKIKILFT